MDTLSVEQAIGSGPIIHTNEELTRRLGELGKITQALLNYIERKDGATMEAISTTSGHRFEIANFQQPNPP